MQSIWKDYFIMLTDSPEEYSEGVRYRVYLNGNEILFEGRAFPKPGDSELYVRLNDIIEPHLQAVLPLEGTDQDYLANIIVMVHTGSGWAMVGSAITFARDWSYDRSFTPGNNPSRPIIKRVHPLQYVPVWTDDNVFDIAYHFTDSVGDYNSDYSADYFIGGEHTDSVEEDHDGTCWFFEMRHYMGADAVIIYNETFPVEGCERYILYYVNAYGGWDWLPVEGKTKETDTVTRHTYDTVYDNRTASARGRFNHVNELQHHFTFYTGWLTDAQSELMHHLLNSVLVYVHDTQTGEVLPVVLTNSSTEHKRNGLNQYTIEADLAQNRLRR